MCIRDRDYDHKTLLSEAIRELGPDAFLKDVLEVVKGKQAVHDRERALISEIKPELNMEGMGRKVNSIKEVA